jgi:hypothetical protein
VLADRLETHAVRRLEFLAGKLPTRPNIGGMTFGPDTWQPSEMAMRAFARYVWGAERPDLIEERVASGAITPEDGEVMRELYPERLAEIVRQIIERLPELQRTLPYHRRLALSILTGVPVEPSMQPRIVSFLQGQFAQEEGSEGGTQAPVASPQFGSISKPQGTPAQERQQQGGG